VASTGGVVDQLMAVEHKPMDLVENQKTDPFRAG